MKRIGKKIVIVVLAVIGAMIVNLCCYVFWGQEKSMAKVKADKELSLYEKCSIYQMHCTCWMLGWTFAPEAAKELFLLHFPQPDVRHLKAGKGFYKSKKIMTTCRQLKTGETRYVTWKGETDYAVASPEHRAAIAVNPCYVTKTGVTADGAGIFEISSPMLYPKYSRTPFNLKFATIYMHEGLYRHLQDLGWMSKFQAVYTITVK